jgi:hypothetical protein
MGRVFITRPERSPAIRSRQQQEHQPDGGWNSLDIEDFSTSCCRTVHACNQNTAQKKHFHGGAGRAKDQAPEQTNGQEAVVQPLVRSQNFAGGRRLQGLAEGSQPGGFVPEEHFEYQDVDVHERNETDNDFCNGGHRLCFCFVTSNEKLIGSGYAVRWSGGLGEAVSTPSTF